MKVNIQKVKEELKAQSEEEKNINSFISIVENHAKIKTLNSIIINTLIDKVVVSDKERINGEKVQKINIIYKFVGSIG